MGRCRALTLFSGAAHVGRTSCPMPMSPALASVARVLPGPGRSVRGSNHDLGSRDGNDAAHGVAAPAVAAPAAGGPASVRTRAVHPAGFGPGRRAARAYQDVGRSAPAAVHAEE